MNPNIIISELVSSLSPVLGLAVVGWTIVAFTRARRGNLIGKTESPPASLQPLEQRLERLEQSNEAIALQVERIAEGQRFMAKLLSKGDDPQGRIGAL